MPTWGGPTLADIDFDNIYYYIKPSEGQSRSWDDVPSEIKNTFDRLGIPEAEKKFLAGVGAQYESEVIYHNIREDLEKQGVIFCGTDDGGPEVPRAVSRSTSARSSRRTTTSSPRSTARCGAAARFIYMPEGVQVEMPLAGLLPHQRREHGPVRAHADHRRRRAPTSTTSRAAPRRPTRSDSLHSAVVEIIVKKGARCRYTTIQNWSQERLQPGDQARRGLPGRDHGVGRRQPGLAS